MATSNTKASKTATSYDLTVTVDENSTAFRDTDARIDALNRRADQLEAVLCTLVNCTGTGEGDMLNSDTIHSLIWLAHGLSREVKLLVEVSL